MSMMMSRITLSAMVVHGAWRIRIAQNDIESAIDRREHETRGNERAQTQHCKNEGGSPVACTTKPELLLSSSHAVTMPEGLWGIK